MGFKTPQPLLKDLLSDTHSGKVQLPDFQRGYVWEDERIRSLLVTVVQGHPMGVILFLEAGNDQVRFKPKPLEGASIKDGDVEPDLLVLDGQQRLTSLGQALNGNGIVQTTNERKKIVTCKYYLHIPTALADYPSLDDAVRSLPGDGVVRENFNRDVVLDVSTRENELSHGYFPLSLAFKDDGTSWLFSYADHESAQSFLNTVLSPMRAYAIPAIQLDRTTTKEAVATVFEKVNQGGVKLTVFELLTAKFAGDANYYRKNGQDFRLKDDWTETEAVMSKYSVLKNFEADAFLQAVTLLTSYYGQGATTARKEDVLNLELQDYLEWAPKVREAMHWVAGFLDSVHVHTAGDVPYPTQMVPLLAIRVLLGGKVDVHGISKRLRQWYWCGVLGELYGSTIETRFARDLEQVPQWAKELDSAVRTPKTVDDANFVESRLHSLRSRNSAAYKGIYALLMAQDSRDWLMNQPFDKSHFLAMSVDIHHIFPKAWCETNNIKPELRESIVNKTPLARKTNIKLGGNAPSKYFKTLVAGAGISGQELDDIIGDHQINVAALRNDRFEEFFTDRRAAIVSLIEKAMGKPVAHDMEAQALGGGSETSESFGTEGDDPEEEPNVGLDQALEDV